MKSTPTNPRKVLVCQNRTCLKQGSAKVLAAFHGCPVSDVTVMRCGCLGQCGNGPMVLVTPEPIWYCRVHPQEVPVIVERHLRGQVPVKALLYSKFHSQAKQL